MDLGHGERDQAIRYVIRKPLYAPKLKGSRIENARKWAKDPAMMSLAQTYGIVDANEPFAMLHTED